MKILKYWGYKVSERRITVDELMEAYKEGKFTEMFGSGTSCGYFSCRPCSGTKDFDMKLSDGKIGALSQKLYDELTGIQWGKKEDPFGLDSKSLLISKKCGAVWSTDCAAPVLFHVKQARSQFGNSLFTTPKTR